MEDVVTGEAVVIDVPCARFPSRMVAIAIDMAVQVVLLGVFTVIVASTAASGGIDAAAAAAIALTVVVGVLVGYPVLFETLSRGRSLGKLTMGLRVVGDDGGPERFRQALVRALAAMVEIWLLMGAPALITSLLSPRGKRLGDLFAGTFVIQERLRTQTGPPVTMPPMLAGWAASLELSGLPDETAAMARSYLARFWELTPPAREEFGRRIAAEVASRISPPPPPGTPPAAYLSAVVAERRAREMARMTMPAGPGGQVGYPPPGFPSPGSPPPGFPPPGNTSPGYPSPGYAPPESMPAGNAPPGQPQPPRPEPQPQPEGTGSAPPPAAGGFTPPA